MRSTPRCRGARRAQPGAAQNAEAGKLSVVTITAEPGGETQEVPGIRGACCRLSCWTW